MISFHPTLCARQLKYPKRCFSITTRRQSSTLTDKKLQECYRVLSVPLNSKQDVVKKAFLDLAKKYHPDSGSPEASIEKFVAIENAFRALTKHNTGTYNTEEVDTIVHDIMHTAPQHRQYLSYEGIGHGTPSQRQKQWAQARAQKAANNVMEHRVAKALASDKTLMKKGQHLNKHDIKTKYGFDRLVEDLIQESMSKGEFENLSGKGKPLKNQNSNPYVDFSTHKLNEVLINNGFTPEWITLCKEIDQDIELLREEIRNERSTLGPHPLSESDQVIWHKIVESNRDIVKSLNMKINNYNLIVPLINRQRLHVKFDEMCEEILKNGPHSVMPKKVEVAPVIPSVVDNDDMITVFIRALHNLITFSKDDKKS